MKVIGIGAAVIFFFVAAAFYAAIALVWRIKLCEILAMACAPVGAAFTLLTLATLAIKVWNIVRENPAEVVKGQ